MFSICISLALVIPNIFPCFLTICFLLHELPLYIFYPFFCCFYFSHLFFFILLKILVLFQLNDFQITLQFLTCSYDSFESLLMNGLSYFDVVEITNLL